MAYATLFLTAFLAATLIPLPSEVPLVVLVRRSGDVVWPVLIATLGNYLGACTTYAVGRGVFARKFGTAARIHPRAASLFVRYGGVSLLFSWVPIIGDAFVALAGAAALRFPVFSMWTIVGKAARYVFVAWLAYAP